MATMEHARGTGTAVKISLLAVIGALLLLSVGLLIANCVADNGWFNVVVGTVVYGLAAGLQAYFLWRLYSDWDEMPNIERWQIGAAGIFIPILAAIATVLVIPIVLAVAFFGGFSGMFDRGRFQSPRSGPLGRLIDRYGNPSGTVDAAGVVRDAYGNTAGSVNDVGEIKDAYGNRAGAVDSTGTVKDEYGNRVGSVDDNGTIKDTYGNTVGRAE